METKQDIHAIVYFAPYLYGNTGWLKNAFSPNSINAIKVGYQKGHIRVATGVIGQRTKLAVVLQNVGKKLVVVGGSGFQFNSGLAKVAVSCFYENEVLNSSSMLLMNSAKNPHLRVAANC